MTGVVQQTASSLASRVSALIEADDVQLPPLPEVATRVQQILSSDEADLKELNRLLSEDAAIVAALLRLANSAVFGGMRQVEDLSTAVQRIGFRQLGAIVTGLSLKGHFSSGSGVKKELLEVLWDHSVTSGFAARAIACMVGADAEKAFLAGLMHDSGKVLVLTAVEKLEKHGFAEAPTRSTLIELMDGLHAELGQRVLTEWKLPDDVAQIAKTHEDEERSTDPLLLCVKAANLITRKLGFHLDPDPEMSVIEDPIMDDLGLDDMTIASMMVEMEDHLLEMKQLF